MASTPKQPSRLRRAVEDAETHRKILELLAGKKIRNAKSEIKGMFDQKPVSKAMTPEDHEKLKDRAVDREKIGTAGAGAGFVLGTKGRELAPGAASWMVRSAKKVGEPEHMARLAHRTKQIRALSNKSGAAIVAAGLGVASQGLASEVHHRRAMGEHPTISDVIHKSEGKSMPTQKSSLGLGDITKSASNVKPTAADTAALGASIAGGYNLGSAGDAAFRARGARKGGEADVKAAKSIPDHFAAAPIRNFFDSRAATRLSEAKRLRRVATTHGVAGAGLTAGALGYVYANRHNPNSSMSNRRAKRDISKAYDPEANRHDRQALESGAAAGGAVVGAGASVASGTHAHRLVSRSKAQMKNAKEADETTRTKLADAVMPNVKASKADLGIAATAHNAAHNARKAAGELRTSAKKFHGGSVASGLAAAGLGAAAYGIQRADRKGRGQTYGYGY